MYEQNILMQYMNHETGECGWENIKGTGLIDDCHKSNNIRIMRMYTRINGSSRKGWSGRGRSEGIFMGNRKPVMEALILDAEYKSFVLLNYELLRIERNETRLQYVRYLIVLIKLWCVGTSMWASWKDDFVFFFWKGQANFLWKIWRTKMFCQICFY